MFKIFNRGSQVSSGPVDADEVLEVVQKKLRSSDAKRIAILISNQHMVVVPDESFIPPSAIKDGGNAYFDAKMTYVVAPLLNRENLFSELVSIGKRHLKRRPYDLPSNWG